MRIAIATCESAPVPDLDSRRLVPALERAGHHGELAVWTDPDVDWAGYDAVWVSSTWDYHERADEFRRWLRRTDEAARLENPAALIEWNLDKRYLRELEEAGVGVIPTIWAEPQGAGTAAAEASDAGWERIVVKPAIDLGAANLKVTEPGGVEDAVAAIDGASLVQPYLSSLEREGEISLVYFRGELAHAVHKQPAAGDFRVQEQYGGRYSPVEPDEDSLALGEDTLAALRQIVRPGRDPLYARVDVVRDDHGEPCVIELELIEPSLFLDVVGDDAADRFAALLTS
jgi:glutathione synthase/RimK-type ligase-like ATP-grasp enzyme